MTGVYSQTFKAARVTVAPDRSRQVVSERNTSPTDDIIVQENETRSEPGMAPPQRLNTQSKPKIASRSFSPNKFYSMMLSVRTFCLLSEGLAASLTDKDPD